MKFNAWIMQKLISSLSTEGCQSSEVKQSLDASITTITDTFGYRYEVSVRCVGRLSSSQIDELMEINPYRVDEILERS